MKMIKPERRFKALRQSPGAKDVKPAFFQRVGHGLDDVQALAFSR